MVSKIAQNSLITDKIKKKDVHLGLFYDNSLQGK